MKNGIFVPIPPVNGNYANPDISDILAEVFLSSFDSIRNITLRGSRRNEVLDILMQYYSLHLSGLKKIHSLDVLKEVFSQL
jgi:DNA repair protein RecO (recombination protein O)